MDSATIGFRAFAFIITLAAVVNGLGIVRWLTALSEYIRRKRSINIRHYWIFNLFAGYQFLLHIILWWMLWGLHTSANVNFLTYLYMLTGPVLLFLGSSLLTPSIDSDEIDIRNYFSESRQTYASVLILFWFWALLTGPVLRGMMAPTAPLFALFLILAVVTRVTANARVHGTVAVLNWLLVSVFVALFAMQLGANAIEPASQ